MTTPVTPIPRAAAVPGTAGPGTTPTGTTPTGTTAPDARLGRERERIRSLILARRPDLTPRLHVGPSGALVIALAAGGCVEVGRMRRHGTGRWVVVAPQAGRARLREPSTLDGVAQAAVQALDAATSPRAVGRADC